MKKYSIDFDIGSMTNKKGLSGKRRTGNVVVKASSASAAKHKFYQTHKVHNGFFITDIQEMKEGE